MELMGRREIKITRRDMMQIFGNPNSSAVIQGIFYLSMWNASIK